MKIILASKSPRRHELLKLVTANFEVEEAGIDEAALYTVAPTASARAVANAKAAKVAETHPNDIVIGCDTIVAIGTEMLGKPRGETEARCMLESLSCRSHNVHTGVALRLPGGAQKEFCETTVVNFALIPPSEIEDVIKTKEPYDKAGGYAIQGWAAKFITGIDGCYYNVMGLPVSALYRVLRESIEETLAAAT